MKSSLFVILLIAALNLSTARAEDNYAGIIYGQANSEDVDTDNLGFVIGSSPDSGAGYEFFYTLTIGEDSLSSGNLEADISLDIYGILAFYKTGDDVFDGYVKFKGGIAVVDLEFDFKNIGSIDDETSGLSYGIAVGVGLGPGALEISYLILPEFDEFQGIELDAEVDFFSVSYQWNF